MGKLPSALRGRGLAALWSSNSAHGYKVFAANSCLLPLASCLSPTAVNSVHSGSSLAVTGSAGGAVLAEMTAIDYMNPRRAKQPFRPRNGPFKELYRGLSG